MKGPSPSEAAGCGMAMGVKVNMQQPPEHSSRLRGQLAGRLRNLHCSLRTEAACVYRAGSPIHWPSSCIHRARRVR